MLQQLLGQAPTLAAGPARTRASSARMRPSILRRRATAAPAAAGPGPLARANAVVTRSKAPMPSSFRRRRTFSVRSASDTSVDLRRQQVLVEAIIVEISDVAAQQLGVSFPRRLARIQYSLCSHNYSSLAPNLGTIAGAFAARELGGTTTTVTTGTGSTTTSTTGRRRSDRPRPPNWRDQWWARALHFRAAMRSSARSSTRSGPIISQYIVDSAIMTLDNQRPGFWLPGDSDHHRRGLVAQFR